MYLHIHNSLNKLIKNQYALKNSVLREYCIIDSLKEFNRQLSAENNECIKELEENVLYRLSLDNDYFHENIDICNNMNILPIRIKNINDENDDEDNSHITYKINIIDIKMNNHYGYIYHMRLIVNFNN